MLDPVFYLATLSAGLIVGAVNYALARTVVGRRMRQLVERMSRVQAQLVEAHTSGDWSGCNPLSCALPVDSRDEVGTSAADFNSLITTLARSHHIETATRGFAQVVASHLDPDELGRDAMRVSGPLGVLMVDLDHFKAVNDTYGHLVGDRVLRAAAAAIRRVTREGDVLIRYGGEEFLVVVPGAGIEDVRELAERVRRAMSTTEVMDGERRISVTASVGASTHAEHDVSSALELVEVADAALYASKESGRDRVTMA